MEYTVHFTGEDREISVAEGATLLQARIAAKLPTDAPCGGKGTCGKCLADVRAPGEREWRRVLLCQTRAEGDLEVRALRKGEGLRVLTDAGSPEAASWRPMVRAVRLEDSHGVGFAEGQLRKRRAVQADDHAEPVLPRRRGSLPGLAVHQHRGRLAPLPGTAAGQRQAGQAQQRREAAPNHAVHLQAIDPQKQSAAIIPRRRPLQTTAVREYIS